MNKKNLDETEHRNSNSAGLRAALADAQSLTDFMDQLNRKAYLRAYSRMAKPYGTAFSSDKRA